MSTPPEYGTLVHRRVSSSIEFAGTHLKTWVERDTVRETIMPRKTIQCSRPGLEPKLFDPRATAGRISEQPYIR